jgi:hypothetical protein
VSLAIKATAVQLEQQVLQVSLVILATAEHLVTLVIQVFLAIPVPQELVLQVSAVTQATAVQ